MINSLGLLNYLYPRIKAFSSTHLHQTEKKRNLTFIYMATCWCSILTRWPKASTLHDHQVLKLKYWFWIFCCTHYFFALMRTPLYSFYASSSASRWTRGSSWSNKHYPEQKEEGIYCFLYLFHAWKYWSSTSLWQTSIVYRLRGRAGPQEYGHCFL